MQPYINQGMVYLFGKVAFECCPIYTICSLLKLKLIQKFCSVDDVGLIHRTWPGCFCLSLCLTKNATEGAEDNNVYKAENNKKSES